MKTKKTSEGILLIPTNPFDEMFIKHIYGKKKLRLSIDPLEESFPFYGLSFTIGGKK